MVKALDASKLAWLAQYPDAKESNEVADGLEGRAREIAQVILHGDDESAPADVRRAAEDIKSWAEDNRNAFKK